MAFIKKIWVNVPDPSELPAVPEGQDALARFDAENMNRIEDGIEDVQNSLDLHFTDEYLHNKSTDGGAFGHQATTDTGGAIGWKAKATTGGAIGNESSSLGGAAVGYKATTTIGAAVGQEASSDGGFAGGYKAISDTFGGGAVGSVAEALFGGGAVGQGASSTTGGGSVGYKASSLGGGAVGNQAIAGNGFSGGTNAKVGKNLNDKYIDAIQLGTGTNQNPNTLQVYDYQLLDADGFIPNERIPKAKTLNVSIPNSWTANSNGGYTQTVNVTGILASDNPIIDIVLGTDIEANKLYTEAWGCIDNITTSNGSISLYAYRNAPEIAFNIQLKVV